LINSMSARNGRIEAMTAESASKAASKRKNAPKDDEDEDDGSGSDGDSDVVSTSIPSSWVG
jgi:hypothetical protein